MVELVLFCAEGQHLRYCGYGANFEEIIFKGDPSEMKVS